MHELLGPIFLVLWRDTKNIDENVDKDEISILLDKKYLEHDCYCIFDQLMGGMKDFFQIFENTGVIKKLNSKFLIF